MPGIPAVPRESDLSEEPRSQPHPGPGRTVRLVLVDHHRQVLGVTPAIEVATPWWQEVEDVVAAVREELRLEVTVLRLLPQPEPDPRPPIEVLHQGGPVTYLAELHHDRPDELRAELTPLPPADGDPLAPHPRRASWAYPGAAASDLGWARKVCAGLGRQVSGPPVQARTWNLSCVWRLPSDAGTAWLKVVPRLARHEGPLLAALQGEEGVPRVIAHQLTPHGGRVLLEHVPDVPEPTPDDVRQRLRLAVHTLSHLQAGWAGRVEELLALGVPDRRDDAAFTARVHALAELTGPQLDEETRQLLPALLAGLPALLERRRACGLPDTLVHGDANLTNLRGDRSGVTLIDWSDSSVAHPITDLVRLVDHCPDADRTALVDAAAAAWRKVAPGCDPASAIGPGRVLATLESALAWQGFLDAIEPDERIYHEGDPAEGVRTAVALHRALSPHGEQSASGR